MAEVGKHIKKIRKERNLTQDDLAERLHCTRQTISNYENGKSEPGIEILVELAGVLEVEINDLIYGSKKKENRKRRKREALLALAAAGVLQIVIIVLSPLAKEYAWENFEMAPIYLMRYVLQPFGLTLLGWGIAEAAKTFGGIRIWEGKADRLLKAGRVLFYVSAVCLAVFTVLALWTGADMVYIWYLSERMMRLQGEFSSSTVSHLMPGQLQNIFLRVTMLYGAKGFCLFLGAALAFCRMEKEELGKEAKNKLG